MYKIPQEIKDLRWEEIEKDFPFLDSMKNCLQDPNYHAEGDVWTHTKMVVEKMVVNHLNDQTYSGNEAVAMFLASLLHDIGKPSTTIIEEAKIRSPKHAFVGSKMARGYINELSLDLSFKDKWHVREKVCNMIRSHSLPFHFLDKEDPLWHVCSASILSSNEQLKHLAESDMLGRICLDKSNQEYGLQMLDLFKSFCNENNCYYHRKYFCKSQTDSYVEENNRFKYFYERKGHPNYSVSAGKPRGTVIIMSGLMGVGKNYTINKEYSHLPVVELDVLRKELDSKFGEKEGQVSQLAKERCREQMREGKDFVFNATNLVKDLRKKWIDLFRQYDYRIVIHYVEKPLAVILKNNKNRVAFVPESVIIEKSETMDIPTLMECHELKLSLG